MSSPRPTTVPAVALVDVAAAADATLPASSGQREVTGVSLDSRTVQPGDLYAALPGFVRHGADFVADALECGAVAVLTDPQGARLLTTSPGAPVPVVVAADPRAVLGDVAALVYGHAARDLTLLGVTGTNGKTTTAYLIESGLRALGEPTGLIGTVETRVGSTQIPSTRTTPEAPDLHALFAVMREAGARTVVMEVSSHALSQHRVDGAVFDVVLFTNLSQDHLDFHPTMEDYFAAKASLFTPQHARRGVVCVDDGWGKRLAAEAAVPVVTLASDPANEADWVVRQGDWPSFTLSGPAGSMQLQSHLPGQFNVVNTALAAVALVEVRHPLEAVEKAMQTEPVVPGRMQVVTATHPDADRDPRCIVDYAHTPDAVEAALRALRPTTPGRLVVVLGAGGDRDRGKRRAMGAAASTWADDVIITDDNPRTENPATIRAELATGAAQWGRKAGQAEGAVATGAAWWGRKSGQAEGAVRAGAGPGDARSVDGSGGRPSLRGRMVAPGIPWSGSPTVTEEGSRSAAIERAVRVAREVGSPGDNTVLVLGKGHETGQEIAGVVHPFDDRDALRAALDGLAYQPEASEWSR